MQGLLNVCPGEERHLVVPADLAYGERGAGDVIPPGATLLFDIGKPWKKINMDTLYISQCHWTEAHCPKKGERKFFLYIQGDFF